MSDPDLSRRSPNDVDHENEIRTPLSPTACYCRSAFEESHCAFHRGGECTRGQTSRITMRETYIDGGGNIPIRSSKTSKQETRQKIIDEAYRIFPDVIQPVDYHPVGKIVVDRGNLRFAFTEGALFAARTLR